MTLPFENSGCWFKPWPDAKDPNSFQWLQARGVLLPEFCTSCKVPLHWLYGHQSQAPMGATWTCLTRGRAHPTASGSPRLWETAARTAWGMAGGWGWALTATRRLINDSTPIDSFWLNLIISLLFDPICISSEQDLSCLVIDKDHQWEWHHESPSFPLQWLHSKTFVNSWCVW